MSLFFRPKNTNSSQNVTLKLNSLASRPLRDYNGDLLSIGKLKKDFLYMVVFDNSLSSDPHYKLLVTPVQTTTSLSQKEIYHNLVSTSYSIPHTTFTNAINLLNVDHQDDVVWNQATDNFVNFLKNYIINSANYELNGNFVRFFKAGLFDSLLILKTDTSRSAPYEELLDEISIQFEYHGHFNINGYIQFIIDSFTEDPNSNFDEDISKIVGSFDDMAEFTKHDVDTKLIGASSIKLFFSLDGLPLKQVLNVSSEIVHGHQLTEDEIATLSANTVLTKGYVYSLTYDKLNDIFKLNLISTGSKTLIASKNSLYHHTYDDSSPLIPGLFTYRGERDGNSLDYSQKTNEFGFRASLKTITVNSESKFDANPLRSQIGELKMNISGSNDRYEFMDTNERKVHRFYFNDDNTVNNKIGWNYLFYIPYIETIGNPNKVIHYTFTKTPDGYQQSTDFKGFQTNTDNLEGVSDTSGVVEVAGSTSFSSYVFGYDRSALLYHVEWTNISYPYLRVWTSSDDYDSKYLHISGSYKRIRIPYISGDASFSKVATHTHSGTRWVLSNVSKFNLQNKADKIGTTAYALPSKYWWEFGHQVYMKDHWLDFDINDKDGHDDILSSQNQIIKNWTGFSGDEQAILTQCINNYKSGKGFFVKIFPKELGINQKINNGVITSEYHGNQGRDYLKYLFLSWELKYLL